jgi:hypothetical protein
MLAGVAAITVGGTVITVGGTATMVEGTVITVQGTAVRIGAMAVMIMTTITMGTGDGTVAGMPVRCGEGTATATTAVLGLMGTGVAAMRPMAAAATHHMAIIGVGRSPLDRSIPSAYTSAATDFRIRFLLLPSGYAPVI